MDLAKFRKNRKGDFECSTMEIGNSKRTDFCQRLITKGLGLISKNRKGDFERLKGEFERRKGYFESFVRSSLQLGKGLSRISKNRKGDFECANENDGNSERTDFCQRLIAKGT
jgi:hypothetical protein